MCIRTDLSALLDHDVNRPTSPDVALSFLTPVWGTTDMFTKTRQEALTWMHCRSDSRTSVVNSVNRADRGPLITLDSWNLATVELESFLVPLWTANKRARTTDSENTVATRTLSVFIWEQGLVGSQATWNSIIWTKYNRRNVHHTCLTFKFSSSGRQDVIAVNVVYFSFTTIGRF